MPFLPILIDYKGKVLLLSVKKSYFCSSQKLNYNKIYTITR